MIPLAPKGPDSTTGHGTVGHPAPLSFPQGSLSLPRLIIAGTHSGVGKTTLTTALICAFRKRGLTVQPFKVGPDYIDPTYHTLAAGRPARNLDTWMLPRSRVLHLFAHCARAVDLCLIEGVMGLYDGFGYHEDTGSTAEVAKLLRAPVILIVDARAMARSAAALALGYATFDPQIPWAGFIVNYVANAHHGRGVAQAIERATGLPVFGWLPREASLHLPERHLGLIPTMEPGRWEAFIDTAAALVEKHLDLEGILHAAYSAPSLSSSVSTQTSLLSTLLNGGVSPPDAPTTIAVARDAAFSFTYPDNLDLLREAGARLLFFSPLHDPEPPHEVDVIILSGGFPEVYAATLAANRSMRRALREAGERGVRIYAECGGLMYLTEEILTAEGERYPMVGLLPGRSVMTSRLTLGYRVAEAATTSWLFHAGERVRGHEFHYSVWEGRPSDLPPAYTLLPPSGQGEPQPEGACRGTVWASYVHLHFGAYPQLALRFARS